ncbi:phage tail protein [Anaerococcus vaginalis]|uniref:phage tail sheath family protein n=1 Tax=Anaerococcus vaginalis TaxID=33037 RepID=UPI0029080F6A|nr:phage tail protein [Anaerococcus vaginalis]MDU6546232.1 phage tail protein [Anaerococcus vaginalis]
MAFQHGIRTKQIETSIKTPVTAGSGIAFVVGTSPIQAVNGKVNEPIMCNSYAEAVKNLGYNDNFDYYTLCEAMYCHFVLYGVSPVVFVNVLDPKKHKKKVEEKQYLVNDKQVLLPIEALADTVVVKSYNKGQDYDLMYTNDNLVLEILDGGNISQETGELAVSFDAVDPTKVTEKDIIGGYEVSTNEYKGLELIDKVFAKYGIITDLILCPKFSKKSTVAAVMATKCENINGIFEAHAVIDLDSSEVKAYGDTTARKKKDNIFSKYQILCWPMVKLGDKKFHLSTQAAARMAKTDVDSDGCPAESPSNKSIKVDGAILEDGTELLLDLKEANYLNSQGIVTAINFIGGYVLWGNQTACFPANTDVKDYFIPIGRMFGWVGNSLILTYWSNVDNKMTPRFVQSIVDSINIWLNGLVSEGKLLGGRVEFKPEDNNLVELMAGKATFHIYLTPPSPAQEIVFALEYDPDYVVAAFQS